jgi:hypothetical protein
LFLNIPDSEKKTKAASVLTVLYQKIKISQGNLLSFIEKTRQLLFYCTIPENKKQTR